MIPKTEKQLRRIEAENERNARRRRMEAAYEIDTFSQAVRDLIWATAWEYGHAYGLQEVEDYYSDLCEIAKAAKGDDK